MELLGRFPHSMSMVGKYSSEIFNRRGELRNIHKLRYWPLDQVLTEKYNHSVEKSASETDFLLPMLSLVPEKRADAGGMSNHKWLADTLGLEQVSLNDRKVGQCGEDIPGWNREVRENKDREAMK